jgi:hypothetical protein
MNCPHCGEVLQIIDGGQCAHCYKPVPGMAGRAPQDEAHNPGFDSQDAPGELPPTTLEEDRDLSGTQDGGGWAPESPGTEFDPGGESIQVPGMDDDRLGDQPRLIGWLVSFSHHPAGRDYPLRQGRNRIGKNPNCDIRLDYDHRVSGSHATIRFNSEGELQIKDNDSQNGTLLNGEDLFSGPQAMKDKDQVTIGGTVLTLYLID